MASDPTSPASIAVAEFATGRRGYDNAEVRAFLNAVSLEMSRVKEREMSLASELDALRSELAILKQNSVARSAVDLDEATVASLLGEEAARVLTTAREGAAQLRARAEREMEAERAQVAEALEHERTAASEESHRIRTEAATDAERIRLEANDSAAAEVEAAKIQGRDMVFEARAYREKVMADLARRRDTAQQQLDVLNLQRGRLRSSFESVRTVLDEIRAELHDGELGPSPLDDLPAISGAFPVVARVTQPDIVSDRDMSSTEVAASEPVTKPVLAVVASAATIDEPDREPEPAVADVIDDSVAAVADAPAGVEQRDDEVVADEIVVADEMVDAAVDDDDVVAATSEPETAADGVEPDAGDDDLVDESTEALAVVHDLVRVRPDKRGPAEDVFARLRASRVDDVGRLQESPSGGRPGSGPVSAPAPAPAQASKTQSSVMVAERHGALAADDQVASDAALHIDPPTAESLAPADEVIDARRNQLAPIEESLARRLKRALADEQSEVLDKLRRKTKKTTLSVADLFGPADAYARRYTDAAGADVMAAARAGASSLSDVDASKLSATIDKADVVGAVSAELVEQLVAPLRDRLERAFGDAGDDTEAAADQFRSLYREWKTQRIDVSSSHAVLAAHGRGALAALSPGTPVCWVVDGEHPCAEGDDNVLAGAVPSGDDFPTGHRHAPAYMGCRCAIALASR
jgi:DivIVA domain-containing protein